MIISQNLLHCLQIGEMERNLTNLRKSPHRKKNNRVRIREGSPKRPITPPSKLRTKTPPPMSMSDEEFRRRYVSHEDKKKH